MFVPSEGKEEWVIITGGGSGIGAMLVKHFAQRGFRVLTCGRRREALTSTKASCGSAASCVTCVPCDIGTEKGRTEFVEALPEGATVRLLIQNAAIGDPAHLKAISLEHWEYAMRTNVTAPLFLAQAMLAPLKRGHGRILHLGTGVAFRPQYGTATYGVTKAAFFRLYQQLNADLADFGIVAGSLSPGVVDTEGVREHITKARAQNLPHVQYFDATYRDNRLTNPRDLLVLFDKALTSDADVFSGHEWSLKDLHVVKGPNSTLSPSACFQHRCALGFLVGVCSGTLVGWFAARRFSRL